MPLASFIKSVIFGLTIALAVGPIALLIVNYGVTRGFASAARSALGAGLADLTYAIVAFVSGDFLAARLEAHRSQFEIAAAFVLVVFGAYLFATSLRTQTATGAAAAPPGTNELATTYALTLFNPLTIVAFAGFAGQLPLAGSTARALLLATAVFLGSVVVQFALAAAGAQLGRWLRSLSVLRTLNAGSGLGIIAFGLIGLWPHVGRG
jgi:threonine/homoserine/homoserine lactone efflux protein